MERKKLRLLVVNYHYIRENVPSRGIYPLTPSQFENKLDEISKNGFKFVSLKQVNDAIEFKDKSFLSSNSCLITFDDGLKESYEVGLSILDKKGIPGAFFVPTFPIETQKTLDVHKFHYVQSQFISKDILKSAPMEFLNVLGNISSENLLGQYPWDDLETAKMKYLVNFILNEDDRNKFIDHLFNLCGVIEKAFVDDFYMNRNQIRILAERGYLGAHGRTHCPLAALDLFDLQRELDMSIQTLEECASQKITSISYPYGGPTAVSPLLYREVKARNFCSGFTMERGLNDWDDLEKRPLALKRFDTNDVYGGKSEQVLKRYLNS
ncbi:MAG: hypothetical protein COW00_00820 [Bdellovibrio sp. CG12_big_fil_rev_8_21_14_0_65_39_13]|nr:MAG: hypothetical protein COW78_20410 [Bdellovibrio sp. CG22_combo_CG10-13_8_21_14_all_39_27]PIQ62797.1 MAG: hypothetical protein COW00_00820 [Bdellovibrio sp. CG12_big_fil_rev_8_21_14_0_65_39_13]PIR32545.1 MAG: hypothetical protein COV37_19595 [Bdellovibrio sp. CG11_big_fil_rev_8_21_14_0_20_39_38]